MLQIVQNVTNWVVSLTPDSLTPNSLTPNPSPGRGGLIRGRGEEGGIYDEMEVFS